MDTIGLKYGNTCFDFALGDARLLEVPAVNIPAAEPLIRQSLRTPLGSPPLDEICRPGERVAIVTSDITRYTGSEIYLPILVEELNRLGIEDRQIEIVIALGIHRPQSAAEHRKILGPLYGRIAVHDHDCDDPTTLVDLGPTESGLPVQINRRVMEADRVIVTGTIGFHYFAGFGGGRKGLVPGVASRETCMASHFAVFNSPEVGGKHPSAVTGVLEGNPVHENLVQAARKVGADFLFNTVLSPEKKILDVFCGDLEAAHLAGCEMVRRRYQVSLPRKADLAVISCGGLPKDINFIQAQKALDYGVNAVREGGTVILLAACPDGFGHPTFFDWFRYQDLEEFEAALRENYQINGQTAHATLARARRFRIILVSELETGQIAGMGMEKADSLQSALRMAQAGLPAEPEVVVIPDGGVVLPRIEDL